MRLTINNTPEWAQLLPGARYAIGSVVADRQRICRDHEERDTSVPVRELVRYDIAADARQVLREGMAGWSDGADGLGGVFGQDYDAKCNPVMTTKLFGAADGRREAGMMLPYPDGMFVVLPSARGVLHVRPQNGKSTALMFNGVIRMMLPVADDPSWVLLSVDELVRRPKRPRPLHQSAMGSVRELAVYVVRTHDMQFFSLETGDSHIAHASLLLNEGKALVTACVLGRTGEPEGHRSFMTDRFALRPSTPEWIALSRRTSDSAAAASSVSRVKASPAGDKMRRMIEQFFDTTLPCNFPGCEALRAKYKTDVAEAGGDDCPSCVHDGIRSKITLMVREQLHALESAAKDAV